MSKKWLVIAALIGVNAHAASSQELLRGYAEKARQENSAFREFSAARGEQFYRAGRTDAGGNKVSCGACHTPDPRQKGKTRANKEILPLAPAANGERLTDHAKVEKWFGRNCQDALQRACTAQEKGDFITYLLSVK